MRANKAVLLHHLIGCSWYLTSHPHHLAVASANHSNDNEDRIVSSHEHHNSSSNDNHDNNHKLSSCQNEKQVLQDLYERCTVQSRTDSTALDACQQEHQHLTSLVIPELSQKVQVLQGMQDQVQQKYEDKLVESSQYHAKYESLALESKERLVMYEQVKQEYEDLSVEFKDTQASYDALKTYNVKRVDELKLELKQMEEEVKQWKDRNHKALELLRDEQKHVKALNLELRQLKSVEQSYCNVTLIYEDASQTAHYYADITREFSLRMADATIDVVSRHSQHGYRVAQEFYMQQVFPFMQKVMLQVAPIVSQVQEHLEETIGPHVRVIRLSIQEWYNEHAKEFVDDKVLPKYNQHIVPVYVTVKHQVGEMRDMVAPQFHEYLNQARVVLKFCRMSFISTLQESSKGILSYLNELSAQQHVTVPENLRSIIENVGDDAETIVDFLSFVVFVTFMITKGIYVLMFPFKLLHGLLFSGKKKTTIVRKKLIKVESKYPPTTVKEFQFQRYPVKVKLEQ